MVFLALPCVTCQAGFEFEQGTREATCYDGMWIPDVSGFKCTREHFFSPLLYSDSLSYYILDVLCLRGMCSDTINFAKLFFSYFYMLYWEQLTTCDDIWGTGEHVKNNEN